MEAEARNAEADTGEDDRRGDSADSEPTTKKVRLDEGDGSINLVKGESDATGDEAVTSNQEDKVQFVRVKTKKYALLVSYCGQGYYGIQRNKPWPTIEEELLSALLKAGQINDEGFEKPQKIYFQRSARTDKGVSAIRQIVSCRLKLDFLDKINEVNEHLPKPIRVIAARWVTKYFDCKNYCDARSYAYLMPSYSLCPPSNKADTIQTYRANAETVVEFNRILSLYKGTHNFHNFTSGKVAGDASGQRFVMQIVCEQPFMADDVEYVLVRIKGQSFMLHQIRKMIALAIAIVRGHTDEETLTNAFKSDKIDIPKAPGLGLMLEEVHFDWYNNRYGKDGIHEPITWSEYNDVVNGFKDEHIYPLIFKTEKEEKTMQSWLRTLPIHTYGSRTPGPPDEMPQDLSMKSETTKQDVNGECVTAEKSNSPQEPNDQ